MKSHSKYILVLVCLLTAALSYAIPPRPNPQRLVNDFANVFTPRQVDRLEEKLVAFDDSTSNQIVVVTVKDLEWYDASEYATRLGLQWGVGSAQFDNGIVLLVKPRTSDSAGQVFIAVGYGLEGAIPDAYAKRIVENELIPNFRKNDYYAGVDAACDVLMQLASGEISEPRGPEEESLLEIIVPLLLFGLMIFCILLAVNQGSNNDNGSGGGRRTIYMGPIITSGRTYGGGSSYGGGFGGFGGFGGGSFGGGGAGGSW